MIKVVLIMLYLLLGAFFWGVGIRGIGGESEYIKQIAEMQNCSIGHATFLYVIALLVTVLFWPFLIIRGIFDK